MSPTSYQLLHPAIYFKSFPSIPYLNLRPPTGGYEPNLPAEALAQASPQYIFKSGVNFQEANIQKFSRIQKFCGFIQGNRIKQGMCMVQDDIRLCQFGSRILPKKDW
jgi:hypothetical protein